MNLSTGLTSPQYHVTFDDEFTTVPYLTSNNPPPNWIRLIKTATERATDDNETLSQKWLSSSTNNHDNQSDSNPPVDKQKLSTPDSLSQPGSGGGYRTYANTFTLY